MWQKIVDDLYKDGKNISNYEATETTPYNTGVNAKILRGSYIHSLLYDVMMSLQITIEQTIFTHRLCSSLALF